VFYFRHIVLKSVWKLQNWLRIGEEKKMTKECKVFDHFIYANIESRRKELRKCSKNMEMVDLLTTLMKEEKGSQVVVHDDKFLRDVALNLFVAGRDTITSALTWLSGSVQGGCH